MDEDRICRALEEALIKEDWGSESKCHDIAFHMTDWLGDLDKWHAYCQNPDSLGSEATAKLLTDFLVHVPNHVAAASKLMLDIPVSDVFDVGATQDDD